MKNEKDYLEGKIDGFKEVTKLILESRKIKEESSEFGELSIWDKITAYFVLFSLAIGGIGFFIISTHRYIQRSHI